MVFRRCYVILFCFLACVLMCKADDNTVLKPTQTKVISTPILNTNTSEPAVSIVLLEPKSSNENEAINNSTKPISPDGPITPSVKPVPDRKLTITDDPIIPTPVPSTVKPDPDPKTTPSTTTSTTTSVPPTTSPTTTSSVSPATTVTTASPTTSTNKPSPTPTTRKPTATPSTVNPNNGSVTTEIPDTHHSRQFDGPSFIGGIVLATGLMAIGFVAFKFYRARTERNYHTL